MRKIWMFLMIVGLLGCSPMLLNTPAGLSAQQVQVRDGGGWFTQGPMQVGQWTTSEVDRGWVEGRSTTVNTGSFGAGRVSKRGGYRFQLRSAGGERVNVGCTARLAQRRIAFHGFTSTSGGHTLSCTLSAGGAVVGTLQLLIPLRRGLEPLPQAPVGDLQLGERRYLIKLAGARGGGFVANLATGAVIYDDGKPLAASQWLRPRAVWMTPATSGALPSGLVAALVGISLFEPLN